MKMRLSDLLLPEFDLEMANTRKTLERVPGDKFDWRPHEKSMLLGYLARHIATLPDWITLTIEKDKYDIEANTYSVPEAANTAEVLALFDESRQHARNAIAEATDEHYLKPWSLVRGETVMHTNPRIASVRSLLNHGIHHRAQLGVYLRLNDIAVPSIYGPSADEGSW
jgi:uncharacterized damage-inducible protein DinB